MKKNTNKTNTVDKSVINKIIKFLYSIGVMKNPINTSIAIDNNKNNNEIPNTAKNAKERLVLQISLEHLNKDDVIKNQKNFIDTSILNKKLPKPHFKTVSDFINYEMNKNQINK